MNRISSRLLAPCLIAAVACVAAGPALAGKNHGGGGTTTGSGSASISLVPLYSHAGGPVIGDTVTFSISTPASSFPYVRVTCKQGSTLAYTETNGFYPTYMWGQDFTLGPTTAWPSGPASCTAAVLVTTSKGGTSTLGSMSFSVSG